jgi:dTDP-4-amino-4,6-dideoxygalactose transaminase
MIIKLNEPDIGDEEIAAATRALRSGQLTQGSETLGFEKIFGEAVSAENAIAVSSATTGLELSLWAMGVGPGDEVIIPDYSWPATGNAVISVGAKPVFADITLDTYCIDVSKIEPLINQKTKAIMPVHAFGHMADMDEIMRIARLHNIKVVEDAACAFGSSLNGKHAGMFGDSGVFSFHPRKIVTTGEGGMVISEDKDFTYKARLGRTHGAVRPNLFAEFEEFGFNFRITEMQAAIGAVQITRSSELLSKRREKAKFLLELLPDDELMTTPTELPGYTHSYQSFVVLLDKKVDRDGVIRSMARREIETTLGTYSMSSQKSFQSINPEGTLSSLQNSVTAFKQALSLPLHPQLSDLDLERVSLELKSALRENIIL